MLSALSPRFAFAMGGDDRFHVGQLAWGKTGWDTRPTAIRRMLQEVEKRTSVEVNTEIDAVNFGPEMFDYPMLFMSGEVGFEPWSDERIDMLGTWLKGGGFLVVDSSEGVSDGPFLRSVRRELDRIFGSESSRAVPKEHVLYKSFYFISEPKGRVQASPTLDAYFDDDRIPVVICANDMLGAWARDGFGRWEFDVVDSDPRAREMSLRLGINLVMYALCVNYKDDQVHTMTILKRRQWKVD